MQLPVQTHLPSAGAALKKGKDIGQKTKNKRKPHQMSRKEKSIQLLGLVMLPTNQLIFNKEINQVNNLLLTEDISFFTQVVNIILSV